MSTAVLPITAMAAREYHAIQALSHSGMKDLAVSPLRYWAKWIDPNRQPCEPTPEMKFGTALHCLVLEGEGAFHSQYARMIDEEDYPDCLVTMDDLRGWLKDKGQTPKGTRKADLIQQVRAVDPYVQIWDELCAEHESATSGKMLCLKEDWDRLWGAAEALKREPKLREILSDGEPEVALFANDPETGIPLKAKLDWLSQNCILDLKTFSQKRGKSIDESVADAIFYEGYYRQAFFYSTLHQLVTGATKPLKFVMAFVESVPPHEVRIKQLRPTRGLGDSSMNLYWQRAKVEVRNLSSLWARCMEEFSERPWRSEQPIEPLIDEDIRQLAY